jgi:ribosomal protein S18 acetylase RimI-like enzyme
MTTFAHDDARLENPAYAALSGVQARFAQRSGRVLRYRADVAPFLALPSDALSEDWRDAIELLPVGAVAATVNDGSPPPDSFTVTQTFEAVQMIEEDLRGAHDPEALTLGAADVPEMLELVRVTEPGPFLERTIELGRYVGISDDGALVAMAGERLHFDGWTEISAVCTAPAHRGHGLASRPVSTLAADIQQRSEHVFLHVLTDNTNAIRLYEELGLRVGRRRTISVLTRARATADRSCAHGLSWGHAQRPDLYTRDGRSLPASGNRSAVIRIMRRSTAADRPSIAARGCDRCCAVARTQVGQMTSGGDVCFDRRVCRRSSVRRIRDGARAKDLGLRRHELLTGENTACVQIGEAFEFAGRAAGRPGRLCSRRCARRLWRGPVCRLWLGPACRLWLGAGGCLWLRRSRSWRFGASRRL